MRLSANLKKCVSLLVLTGFTLAITGCAPEATTPAAKPPAGERHLPETEAPREQAGSDEGAEVPNPADAQPGAGETPAKEE